MSPNKSSDMSSSSSKILFEDAFFFGFDSAKMSSSSEESANISSCDVENISSVKAFLALFVFTCGLDENMSSSFEESEKISSSVVNILISSCLGVGFGGTGADETFSSVVGNSTPKISLSDEISASTGISRSSKLKSSKFGSKSSAGSSALGSSTTSS